jgi:hypothetical protein
MWNYEVIAAQMRQWLRDLDIGEEYQQRAAICHLRGYRVPFGSKTSREWAIRWLGEREVEFWIIDPFARAYGGDENNNTEVGRWCEWVDEIKRKAGVVDCLVSTHTGWSSDDRSRGAARLSDWADSLWRLNVDKKTDVRYFSAFGRGVDVSEFALKFDEATGRLSRDEIGGSRAWQRHLQAQTEQEQRMDEQARAMVKLVEQAPGIETSDLKRDTPGNNNEFPRAKSLAIEGGALHVHREGRKRRHYPGSAIEDGECHPGSVVLGTMAEDG